MLAALQKADVLLGLIQEDWRPRCEQDGLIFHFLTMVCSRFWLARSRGLFSR